MFDHDVVVGAARLRGLAAWVLAVAGACASAAGVDGALAPPGRPGEGLKVTRNGYQGAASFVRAADGGAIPIAAPKGRARLSVWAFWDLHGALFGVTDPGAQLEIEKVETDPLGYAHTTFRQVHKGVKVFSGVVKVHQDARGNVVGANGRFYPVKATLDVKPTINADGAAAAARREVFEAPGAMVESKELVVVNPGWYGDPDSGARLAYQVVVADEQAGLREAMFIDAHTGEVIDRWSLIEQLLNREVYDGEGGTAIPGTLARPEGGAATGIADVDAGYDYAGDFYRYLQRGFGRDSIDNAGLTIRITANSTAPQCPNAYWNGARAVFCAGMMTDDVVAHELAHGLTGYTAGLIYQNQSGQLNESFSDVFGECVDLFNGDVSAPGSPGGTPWPQPPGVGPGGDTPNNPRSVCSPRPGHPDGVRWLVGEDVNSGSLVGAIRDMYDPTCRNHPDRANSPLQTCNPNDSGGVHSGSGVPNHAFMLATDGGSFNGRTISGIGLVKSGAVWYRALTVYLTPASDFKDAYDAFTAAAGDLVGTSPNDPRTGLPGEVFTAFDAAQIDEALLSTEMNTDGACGQSPVVLEEALPDECAGAMVIYADDFEGATFAWTVANSGPPTPYDWVRTTWALPRGRAGRAAYCEDRAVGDCSTVDESGVHTMTSPSFSVPAGAGRPFLAFTHSMGSEGQFDGGTVELSVNGGEFVPVPREAVVFNAYNGRLTSSAAGNTNPLAGRDAWTGYGNNWGRTIVDLSGLGLAGSSARLRFVFGKDGCTGSTGWYVDDVAVYDCPDCDGDGRADLAQYRHRASSPVLAPIGVDENRSFTLVGLPAAAGTVLIDFIAKADLSAANEFVEVTLNGASAGRVFESGGTDCTQGAMTAIRATLPVSAAAWNAARAAGPGGNTVEVLLTGSAAVNPAVCLGTYIAASVRYDAAGPADANGNLVPDECETQCPSVTQQPEAEVLPCIGGALSLSVAASGSPAPTYQWTRNGANIDGATSATLAVSPVGVADTGEYRCVVTNACGSATSEPSQVTVCAADFNCTGLPATVQDIFDFLNGYFSGDPRADVNGSGGVSVQDIFDFLSAYFSGC